MYNILILEIHDNYAIGICDDGQMLRIKMKKGLNVGDKVYVLEEDIIQSNNHDVPFYQTNGFKQSIVAFALIVLCVFVWHSSITPVYATLSIDGNGSIQLTVDRNGIVQDAQSLDHSYSEQQLSTMIGKSIQEIDFQDPTLIGAAPHKNRLDENFIQLINQTFGDKVIIAYGDMEDIEKAEENNTSLGAYLIEYEESSEVIEELFENFSFDQLQQLIVDNPDIANNKLLNEIIEDKIEENFEQDSYDDNDETEDFETNINNHNSDDDDDHKDSSDDLDFDDNSNENETEFDD